MSNADPKRELLRHALATLAYRGAKPLRDVPASFADFSGAGRTPVQILAHIGDLLDWALSLARGQEAWKGALPRSWAEESRRFHDGLQRFDDFLKGDQPLGCEAEGLFQGPIADALTHVGQIATLRRLAGAPVRGESHPTRSKNSPSRAIA